jgi:hypothetical protein
MHGPVTTGIRTFSRTWPDDMPMWGRHLGDRILWNAETRRTGDVQSLRGQYITTKTHHLPSTAQGYDIRKLVFSP